MSGIEELKKKAKMSIDEMFSDDNQHVDKVIKQQNDHQNTNSSLQESNHSSINSASNSKEKRRLMTDYKTINQATKQNTKFTHRMTFWMTEEIYDIFNEIYAKRMMDKKKTDKCALFCEAIQFWAENGQE